MENEVHEALVIFNLCATPAGKIVISKLLQSEKRKQYPTFPNLFLVYLDGLPEIKLCMVFVYTDELL